MARNPNPLLQELLGARRPDHSAAVARAAWAQALRYVKDYSAAEKVVSADPLVRRILDPLAVVAKADATVATTSDVDDLLQSAVGGYFASLQNSAGARLISASLNVSLGTLSSINFPRADAAPTAADWIAEGGPIPVYESTSDADALGPRKKFATMLVVTRELVRRTSGFPIFTQMLQEKAAASLDAALFGDQAGSSSAHAGLRYGLTPLASYGDAVADVGALLGELASIGGSGQAAIVCNPIQASAIAVKLPQLSVPVWPTRALPSGKLLGIDPSAFVASFTGIDIEASESGLIHMSDAPGEIVSGTGPTTADPVRSLYQTAAVGIRMIAEIAFVARNGLVVSMEGVEWI